MPAKKIVFCTFGSLGDLYPILAVAAGMKRRGHAPTVATSRCYRELVESRGIDWHDVRPDVDVTDPARLRLAMDRRTGMKYILNTMIFPGLRDSYEDTAAAVRDADLMVTHPVTLSAFLVARKLRLPWATIALAPASLYSVYDPPLLAGLPFAERLVTFGPGFQSGLKKFVTYLFELDWKPYRQFERELGLTPTRNPMLWIPDTDLILALFSPVLGPPQRDWPATTRIAGFPFLPAEDRLPDKLADFLNAGAPPIVFTLGSAAVGAAGDFFLQSAQAAERLGQRSVLLVGRDPRNQPPGRLPAGAMAVPYAAHSALFPRASVVVHQGGIGTTAEAMRAGKPTLVVPYSHDQPDHGRRLARLGMARTIPRERYASAIATCELDILMKQASYAERSAAVSAQVREESGAEVACDLLCSLLQAKGGGAELRRRAALVH